MLAWSRAVDERLATIPGVKAVGSTTTLPFRRGRETLANVTYLGFEEQVNDPDHPRPVHPVGVSREFFDAMGIRMIAGRRFTADDRVGTTPVVIVNQSFVRRYLAGRDPLTARFAIGYPTIDPKSMMTVVGVVDDVKYGSLAEVVEPIYYTPLDQTPTWQPTIVLWTALSDPSRIGSAVRAAVSDVDPQLLIRVEPLSQTVASSLGPQRLGLLLMSLFALAALGLAAIGIYGVIVYASAQRVGEVATRMALGATPSHVFWLMMNQGRTLAIAGTIIGLGVAYAAGRAGSGLLYEVRASDPVTLISATALVVGITFLSIVVPARRASQVDPSRILRLD